MPCRSIEVGDIARWLAGVEAGETVGGSACSGADDGVLVAVADDYQYLYELFSAEPSPPAIAYGVRSEGAVHSLVYVSLIDVPAGHAQFVLRRVSGSGTERHRALGYRLGLDYLFCNSPVGRVDVALRVGDPLVPVPRELQPRVGPPVVRRLPCSADSTFEIVLSVQRPGSSRNGVPQ